MSKDQEVRLSAVLDWLAKGRISTESAAARVRKMKFAPQPGKTTFQQMGASSTGDPEPPRAGTFFAISDAFASGQIDQEQYAALAQAAAEAMRDQQPAQ